MVCPKVPEVDFVSIFAGQSTPTYVGLESTVFHSIGYRDQLKCALDAACRKEIYGKKLPLQCNMLSYRCPKDSL